MENGQKNTYFLVFLLAPIVVVLSGFREALNPESQIIDLGLSILLAFIFVTALLADAKQREYNIPMLGRWLLLPSWTISCSYYLVWSRGWKGLLFLFAAIFTFLFCWTAGAIAGFLLTGKLPA